VETMRQDLLEFRRLDTLALVNVHERLIELSTI